MSIKETLTERVQNVRLGMNSLQSSDYGNVFFWQEICSLSDKELDIAWQKLQAPERGKPKIKPDDELRKLGEGTHNLITTKLFSVQIALAKGARTFGKDQLASFLAELCHKYKILDTKSVLELVEKHTTTAKPRLTKRVIENVRE